VNIRYSALCAACCTLAATAPSAETFSIALGSSPLGQLSYTEAGNTKTLRSTLQDTPLGVFDGSYLGTASPHAGGVKFVGVSQSSRKSRTVSTVTRGGRAVETVVTPSEELTELSDPAKAPAGVTDPVTAIGQLIAARGCPGTIRIYDGRRAIALVPAGQRTEGATLICDVDYRVTHGPGHLSPLRVSNANMQLTYATSNGRQSIAQISLGSGPFTVYLNRVE